MYMAPLLAHVRTLRRRAAVEFLPRESPNFCPPLHFKEGGRVRSMHELRALFSSGIMIL